MHNQKLKKTVRPFLAGMMFSILTLSSCKTTSPSKSEAAAFDATNLKVIKGFTILENLPQAFTWYASYRQILTFALGEDPGDPLDASDGNYQILQDKVNKLWSTYQQLHPDRIGGVPAPLVVILQNIDANAFATYDRATGIDPNIFFVNTGLLTEKFKKNSAILGVIAHELAHHALGHTKPGESEKVSKFYRKSSGSEPLGRLQKNDEGIEKAVGSWIEAAQMVGPFPLPELTGYPAPTIGTPFLYTAAMAAAAANSTRESCQQLPGIAFEASRAVSQNLNHATQTIHFSKTESLSLIRASAGKYNTSLRSCLEGVQVSIMDILLALQKTTEEKALDGSFLSSKELGVIKRKGNLAESLIEFAQLMSERKAKINKELNLDLFRIYTFEEQADDEAIQALLKLGLDSAPLTTFFRLSVPEEHLAACDSSASNKTVPPYGILSDKHHSICYRIFHAAEVEKSLRAQ